MRPDGSRPDPFAAEAPLFTITRATLAAHAAELPEGARALFAAHPGFAMRVYPSHRTAALPPAVLAATARNAAGAAPAAAGIRFGVRGAIGGIPFPRPRSGGEAVWNHLLAYWGQAREATLATWVAPGDGSLTLATAYRETADFPYYQVASPSALDGYYFRTRHEETAPAAKAGQAYVAWQTLDASAHPPVGWRRVPGERRVRRGPALAYDTPDPEAEGYQALDDYYLFFGPPDRYEFRLVGKAAMIVPYNATRFYSVPAQRSALGAHENPEWQRYERHRVWIVEGTLAPGASHTAPRRRLYLDEDSWIALYAESWDERGRLWKFSHAVPLPLPEVPAVIQGSQFTYDLIQGGYALAFHFQAADYKVTAPHEAGTYSPAALR